MRYNSRNGSELVVASVYRHVQHHALIKDNSQISKIISIIILTVKILHGTEREICTYWQRFWIKLIEIEKVHILNNIFKTLFHTNIKCKRRILRFTADHSTTIPTTDTFLKVDL